MPSLPPVSAKVIADVEKFIADFKRAEQAANRSSLNIDKEVDRLTKSVSKKFSLSDVGKDVLKGFGLGSGFAVAQQAADLLVGHFERAAQAAKDMEESSARQLSNTKELIRLNQTDKQALATLNKEFESEAKRLAELQKPRTITTNVRRKVFGDYETVTNTTVRERTAEENAELSAQIELVQKLDAARKQLANTLKKADQDAADNKGKKASQDAMQAYRDEEEIRKKIAANIAAQDDELTKLAAKYEEVADPTKRYTDQIREAEFVARAFPERANAMARAIENIKRAMVEDEGQRVDKALRQFFDPIDEQQKELEARSKKTARAAQDIGWAFSSAFEDAILSGAKFSDVLRGLGQDILRIAIRTAITQPIGAAIGGLFSAGLGAAFTGIFGGGKASGGPVAAGTTYMVGEEGPEMFVPKTSGAIIPTDKLQGSGGNTYVIDARGADVGAVDRIAAALRSLAGPGVVEKRALAAVAGARRRGYST